MQRMALHCYCESLSFAALIPIKATVLAGINPSPRFHPDSSSFNAT
jgi:hypothetical protein